MIKSTLLSLVFLTLLLNRASAAEHASDSQPNNIRPNIPRIVVDDLSQSLSCYGKKLFKTPER